MNPFLHASSFSVSGLLNVYVPIPSYCILFSVYIRTSVFIAHVIFCSVSEHTHSYFHASCILSSSCVRLFIPFSVQFTDSVNLSLWDTVRSTSFPRPAPFCTLTRPSHIKMLVLQFVKKSALNCRLKTCVKIRPC